MSISGPTTKEDLITSLENSALTTGAGANCFFQGFIHTLCVQNNETIDGMKRFRGAAKLIEVFNREVTGVRVADINQLIIVAKAMHPLERELIFGPLMRKTLNELDLHDSLKNPLTLGDDSIIFPPHAIAFAHAFGFSFDEYTHINDAEGMPDKLKNDVIGEGGSSFYRVQHSLHDNVGTLILRLKSCHFEVGGLTPEQVQQHQSQIKSKVLELNSERPELPGARFYEEPRLASQCAVKNAKIDFSTAVKNTVDALREREGPHLEFIRASKSLDIGRSSGMLHSFSNHSIASSRTKPLESKSDVSKYSGANHGMKVDVTDEEMARSAFGQESNTAKINKFRKS